MAKFASGNADTFGQIGDNFGRFGNTIIARKIDTKKPKRVISPQVHIYNVGPLRLVFVQQLVLRQIRQCAFAIIYTP